MSHTRASHMQDARNLLRKASNIDGDNLGPLERLALAQEAIKAVTNYQTAMVEACRKDGATWQQIADQLDITRQRAMQRYAK